jgi:LPS export ABC transporter protein LptC
MKQSLLEILRSAFHRRNIVISSLLFLIVVIQLLVLMPRDLDVRELDPDKSRASRADKKRQLPRDTNASFGKSITDLGNGALANSNLSGEGAGGQILRGVHSIEVNSEGKGWELWADRGVRPKDSGEWKIETVRVKFYASNGVTYNVTGRTGGVNPATYDLWIKGNVETKSSNGYTFKSPSAVYNSKLKKLISSEAVEMIGPTDSDGSRLELSGEDMFADLNSNDIKVNRKVQAKKRVHGEKTAQIQSAAAHFSGATNLAAFTGGVTIDVETMRITGPEARFTYDAKRNALESLMVAGGVKVTDSDKFATSGSLSVYFKDDRYIFKGAPRVVQNEDELIGDEIVFLQGGKQVQVINAKAQVDPARATGTPRPAGKVP